MHRGTALGDAADWLTPLYSAFGRAGWRPSHLALFAEPNVPDITEYLLAQDVVWVMGGSVANLLALWRLHGVDQAMRTAWEAGVVLMGVSAGSICWFEGGTTDSFGLPLHPVTNGLGFLPYSNSPHHDAEEQRRPAIHRLIGDGTLPEGYATDDGTGLVFEGTELVDCVTEVEGAQHLAHHPPPRRDRRGNRPAHPPAPLLTPAPAPGGSVAGVHEGLDVGEGAARPGRGPARCRPPEPGAGSPGRRRPHAGGRGSGAAARSAPR